MKPAPKPTPSLSSIQRRVLAIIVASGPLKTHDISAKVWPDKPSEATPVSLSPEMRKAVNYTLKSRGRAGSIGRIVRELLGKGLVTQSAGFYRATERGQEIAAA